MVINDYFILNTPAREDIGKETGAKLKTNKKIVFPTNDFSIRVYTLHWIESKMEL